VVDTQIPPESKSVDEDGDDLIADELRTPNTDVQSDAEYVTDVAPGTVKTSRNRKAQGIDENGEVNTETKPDSKPESVLEDMENVTVEDPDAAEKDSRDKGDTDFAHVEANFKKLYASRAEKMAKTANAQFVDQFVRVVKIASQRMLLNYDSNPFKSASFDVLVEAGLEPEVAGELTERIASLGHGEFLEQLLERTASLMKKSEEYLKDVEADLSEMKPKPVAIPASEPKRSSRSASLRRAASEGNFVLPTKNIGTTAPRSTNNHVSGIRAAVGDTALSRLVSRVAGQ
jgi:hypothetical protein